MYRRTGTLCNLQLHVYIDTFQHVQMSCRNLAAQFLRADRRKRCDSVVCMLV